MANPGELGPRVNTQKKDVTKNPAYKKSNEYSLKGIGKSIDIKKNQNTIKGAKKNIKNTLTDLQKKYTTERIANSVEKERKHKSRNEVLKVMDSRIEKSLKGQKLDNLAKVIKDENGKKFKDPEKAKEFIREQFLKGEIKELDSPIKDKNGKSVYDSEGKVITKTKYQDILEKNKEIKYIKDNIGNENLTKELIAVYGEKKLKSIKPILEQLKKEGKEIPDSLEGIDEILEKDEEEQNKIEEQNENKYSKKNTIEGKEINKRVNSKGEEIPNKGSIGNGDTVTSSYNGNSYKSTSSVGENVNTDNIDKGIKSLSKVNNNENDKKLLENKGLSEHNKELIFKRIPKEWFNVAIAFAKKEGKDIKDNVPIALASISKKTGLISYPNGTSEQTPIITADLNHNPPKTNIQDTVMHFNGAKISGIGKSAALSYNSHTTLAASIQSPEGMAEGGKWWHGVADRRFPNGKTFGCIGIKQTVAMRLARSTLKNGGGYGYEVA